MRQAVICCSVGVILAIAGVSVLDSLEAWAIIALCAVNGYPEEL